MDSEALRRARRAEVRLSGTGDVLVGPQRGTRTRRVVLGGTGPVGDAADSTALGQGRPGRGVFVFRPFGELRTPTCHVISHLIDIIGMPEMVDRVMVAARWCQSECQT
ncbi:hypothetical protein ABZ707_06440 [Streptomyces sp. NPDC006923]|uniref:hypothetical protein n=1 Tax=Streptomyces sp. NPDC006923 TaxID=3155355 RepID=UPI0033C50B71